MAAMFMIEDEWHAEPGGNFATFAEALAELRRRADIAWDVEPNRAPCVGWQTCGRAYEIVEYDDSQVPWNRLRTVRVLELSAEGVRWVRTSENA